MQLNESAIGQRYGPYFRLANLSPAQIARFKELLASDWLSELALTPGRMGLGPVDDGTIEQIDQVVGPQAAGLLRTYRDSLLNAYYLTNGAMSAAGLAGVPLSDQQTDQLAQGIAGNSSRNQPVPDGVAYKYAVAAAVDWDAVLNRARTVLSPAQFDAVQGAFLKIQLDASEAMALGGRTAPAAKPQ
jgi:hypothetical protein